MPNVNMLSTAARAVCVASLCLAATTTTTTTTEAFLVPPVALKGAAVTRGHHHHHYNNQRNGVSCVRCNTRVAATMKGHLDDSDSTNTSNYTSKLSALRHRLMSRPRGSSAEDEVDAVAAGDEVSITARVRRRARAVMRKSFMAVATAVIVRASFNPQAASAVGYRPRTGGAPSSRQVQPCLQ